MKKLKFITSLVLLALFAFTSCQDEIDTVSGENPNTNNSSSKTASNLKRISMYDGSYDDVIDNSSYSSVVLPVNATVNGLQVTILSELDFLNILNILNIFNNDTDVVSLNFPFTVKLSNYTEAIVTNQLEYDAIINAFNTAESQDENAIYCLNIDFPITISTFSLKFQQTGSVVIETEQQLYVYMSNLESTDLFTINYPITATFQDNTTVTINNDLDLQTNIDICLSIQAVEEQAKNEADALEAILVNGLFKVDYLLVGGINLAVNYTNYTLDFSNDLSLVAKNSITSLLDLPGTYEVSSETQVYLNLNFPGVLGILNSLNNDWEVISFNTTSISLQSKTNTASKLILSQI